MCGSAVVYSNVLNDSDCAQILRRSSQRCSIAGDNILHKVTRDNSIELAFVLIPLHNRSDRSLLRPTSKGSSVDMQGRSNGIYAVPLLSHREEHLSLALGLHSKP